MSQRLKHWKALRLEVVSDQEELLSWLMVQCGATGCEIEILDAGKIFVKAFFEGAHWSEALLSEVVDRLDECGFGGSLQTLTVKQLEDEDWASKWKVHFQPLAVGKRLLICPPWQKQESGLASDRQMVIIDPGAAFGTGLHATTRYCLKTIESISLGKEVVDVGTGSAILAIACALLDESAVITAIDVNSDALVNAHQNVHLNNVQSRIKLIEGEAGILLQGQFNTILSNLTCEEIIALLPKYMNLLAPAGNLICAGVLNDRFSLLQAAVEQYPLSIVDREVDGEWVGVTFRKEPARC